MTTNNTNSMHFKIIRGEDKRRFELALPLGFDELRSTIAALFSDESVTVAPDTVSITLAALNVWKPITNNKELQHALREHKEAKPMRLHVTVGTEKLAGTAVATAAPAAPAMPIDDAPPAEAAKHDAAFEQAAARLVALGVPMTGENLRVVMSTLNVPPRRLARVGLADASAELGSPRGRPPFGGRGLPWGPPGHGPPPHGDHWGPPPPPHLGGHGGPPHGPPGHGPPPHFGEHGGPPPHGPLHGLPHGPQGHGPPPHGGPPHGPLGLGLPGHAPPPHGGPPHGPLGHGLPGHGPPPHGGPPHGPLGHGLPGYGPPGHGPPPHGGPPHGGPLHGPPHGPSHGPPGHGPPLGPLDDANVDALVSQLEARPELQNALLSRLLFARAHGGKGFGGKGFGGKGFGGKGFGRGGVRGGGKGFGGKGFGGKGFGGKGFGGKCGGRGVGFGGGFGGRPGLALAHALQIPLHDARELLHRARHGDDSARATVKLALSADPDAHAAALAGPAHACAHRVRKLAKALGVDVGVARGMLIAARGASGDKPVRPAKVIAQKLEVPLPKARMLLHAAINGDEAVRARLTAAFGIDGAVAASDAMTSTEDETEEEAAIALATAVATTADGEDSDDMGWDAIDGATEELKAVQIA